MNTFGKRSLLLLCALGCAGAVSAQTAGFTGLVVDAVSGDPIGGALVAATRAGTTATTDANGVFGLVSGDGATALSGAAFRAESAVRFSGANRELHLSLPDAADVELTLFDVRGQALNLHRGSYGAGEYSFSLDAMLERPLSTGLYVLRAKVGGEVRTFSLAGTGDVAAAKTGALRAAKAKAGARATETITVTMDGYAEVALPVYEQSADIGLIRLTPESVSAAAAPAPASSSCDGVPAFATGVDWSARGYQAVWNNSLYTCAYVPYFCNVGAGHTPVTYAWTNLGACGSTGNSSVAVSSSSKKVSSSSSQKASSSSNKVSSSSQKASSSSQKVSSSSQKASSSSAASGSLVCKAWSSSLYLVNGNWSDGPVVAASGTTGAAYQCKAGQGSFCYYYKPDHAVYGAAGSWPVYENVGVCGGQAVSSSSQKVSSSSQKVSSSSSQKASSSSQKVSSSSSQKASSSSQKVSSSSSVSWNKANLTWYTSWPEPGSEECEDYNGCTWAGRFAGVEGQMSEEWVAAHNIIAIHEKDWNQYKLKTFRLSKGGYTIDAQVLDMCSDSDCNGCCTRNANANGHNFLIDIESYTKARFHNQGSGTVEWICLDCNGQSVSSSSKTSSSSKKTSSSSSQKASSSSKKSSSSAASNECVTTALPGKFNVTSGSNMLAGYQQNNYDAQGGQWRAGDKIAVANTGCGTYAVVGPQQDTWNVYLTSGWTGSNGTGVSFVKIESGAGNGGNSSVAYSSSSKKTSSSSASSNSGRLSWFTESMFNSYFPNRNPVYTWAAFQEALAKVPDFIPESLGEAKQREELAAVFAHWKQEVADLYYVEEICGSNGTCLNHYNTDWSGGAYPAQPGKSYHGRGAKQLSWPGNYGQFSEYYFGDKMVLLRNPERVMNEGVLAFASSFWFWAVRTESGGPCSRAFWNTGFGATTNIVNGALECGGAYGAQAQARESYYGQYLSKLGASDSRSYSAGCR